MNLSFLPPLWLQRRLKLWEEQSWQISHKQSIKDLSRKNWVAVALLPSVWRGGISGLPCQVVPLPANVFGKDGVTAKAMGWVRERSHSVPLPREPLFWRQIYTLELVKCFRAGVYFCFSGSSGVQVFPKAFGGGQ